MEAYRLSISVGWPNSKTLLRRKHFKEAYVFPQPAHRQSTSEGQQSWFAHQGGCGSLDQMVHQALFSVSPSPPLQSVELKPVDLTTELEEDEYELDSMETVYCALPLTSPNNGTNIIVMGSQNGVWSQTQTPNEDEPSLFRRIIDVENAFQLGFIPEANLLVVRSEEDLSLHRIESVVPEWGGAVPHSVQETKLAGRVGFFTIIRIENRTLIVCEIRGFNHCSTLRVFELPKRLGASGGIPRFKVWKDWSAGKPIQSVTAMGSKLAVLSGSTIELVDLVNRKEPIKVIFDSETSCAAGTRTPNVLASKLLFQPGKALGCFRTGEDEYLLCYDKFGLFVNGEGEPIDVTMITEWNSGGQSITASGAIYKSPFLYLFGRELIEVRRFSHLAKSGRRLDVIHSVREEDIVVLSDSTPSFLESPGGFEAQPIVVSVAGKSPGVKQEVFKVSMS